MNFVEVMILTTPYYSTEREPVPSNKMYLKNCLTFLACCTGIFTISLPHLHRAMVQTVWYLYCWEAGSSHLACCKGRWTILKVYQTFGLLIEAEGRIASGEQCKSSQHLSPVRASAHSDPANNW